MILKILFKRFHAIVLLAICIIVFTGCSGNGGGAQEAASDGGAALKVGADPVTVTISRPLNLKEDAFEQAINDYVKKKYPYITLEWIDQGDGNSLEEQIAAGNPPDMMLGGTGILPDLPKLGLTYDLTPLVQKFHYDLGNFEPVTLELVRSFAEDGKALVALPYAIGFNVMYYNKDIFDKFGVSYPKDGMTWDDVEEMAKKVTRSDGGEQYLGIGFSGNSRYATFQAQYGLKLVDEKTNKADINTDDWKKIMERIKSLYDISGKENASKLTLNTFAKDKKLAMFVATNEVRNMPTDANWDMVSIPSPKELPNVGGTQTEVVVAIASSSKHKDQAFQVLTSILSDEVQTVMANNGRPTPFKSEKLKQEFGKNVAGTQGKNLQAIYKTKPPKIYKVNEYDSVVAKELNSAINDVIQGKADINTALREAEEKANQAIAAENTK